MVEEIWSVPRAERQTLTGESTFSCCGVKKMPRLFLLNRIVGGMGMTYNKTYLSAGVDERGAEDSSAGQ